MKQVLLVLYFVLRVSVLSNPFNGKFFFILGNVLVACSFFSAIFIAIAKSELMKGSLNVKDN